MMLWLNDYLNDLPLWVGYIALPLIGIAAGFVNTLAGGGSFVTLPALMFLFGLDPQAANATNRLSVLLQTGTGTFMFKKHGFTDIKLAFRLFIPAICGSTIGAAITEILPKDVFSLVFGAAMLGMAIMLMFKPKLLLATNRHPLSNKWSELLIFFLIGIYGGFVQAGVGLLLLVALSLFHPNDLSKSNAVKVTIAFLLTFSPIIIFTLAGQIVWAYGFLLALGTVPGAIIGAKFAIKKGATPIFYFIIVIAVLTSMKLIGTGISTMIA